MPMAPVTNLTLLAHFRDALREWRCDGFVIWKRQAAQQLRDLLDSHTQKSIAKLMHEHAEAGGVIDQVRERRPEYASRHEYHFDFRLSIDGRFVYLETTLDVTSTGPIITIVSLHDV
jgi:hypothetical protein